MRKPDTITGNYPAANTAAVVTLAAAADTRHHVRRVIGSYSAAPTGGRLTVAFGASVVLDVDIIAGGPFAIDLADVRNPDKNEAVTVTLAAGGGTVVGKLNVVSVDQ